MAIMAYVGLPGSGKSYSVVENVILPSLRKGRRVVTNIPLVQDEIVKEFGSSELVRQITVEEKHGSDIWAVCEPGAVVVLDEVWRLWPSGLKASDMAAADKAFLAEHRHRVGEFNGVPYSMEIVVVVQDLGNIAGYVAKLVDTTFRTEKLDHVGAARRFRVDVYKGGQKGPKYPKPFRQLGGSYKPEVYRFYKSHTLAAGDFAGKEEKPDGRGNVFAGWFLRFGVPLALLCVVFGIWRAINFFRQAPAPAQPVASVSASSVPLARADTGKVAVPVPSDFKRPEFSKIWRLVGVVEGQGGKRLVYLRSAYGDLRRIDPVLCDRSMDIRCQVDGEIVTAWTGHADLTIGVAPPPSVLPVAKVNP